MLQPLRLVYLNLRNYLIFKDHRGLNHKQFFAFLLRAVIAMGWFSPWINVFNSLLERIILFEIRMFLICWRWLEMKTCFSLGDDKTSSQWNFASSWLISLISATLVANDKWTGNIGQTAFNIIVNLLIDLFISVQQFI